MAKKWGGPSAPAAPLSTALALYGMPQANHVECKRYNRARPRSATPTWAQPGTQRYGFVPATSHSRRYLCCHPQLSGYCLTVLWSSWPLLQYSENNCVLKLPRMAAGGLLAEYPELGQFVLTNVRPTGIRIGAGAYGSVEEVAVPGAICAAKKIHDIFLDRSEIPVAEISRATSQFVRECHLMSILRHPNIAQFLGMCFLPSSRLPALVMERLLTSFHDLLDPETDSPLPPDRIKPFFPLSLKCSILQNVACGLAYLHERSPPIIHRDLSARNILLNSVMVAKIVDLGMARIVPRVRVAATMTKGPGASVYMPPEATAPSKSNSEKSK